MGLCIFKRELDQYWMSVMGHNITNVTLNLIQGHIKMLIFSKDEMLKQVQHDAKNTHYDIKRIIKINIYGRFRKRIFWSAHWLHRCI